jgi:flagellar protein FliS
MLMQGGLDRIAQAKGALDRNDLATKGLCLGKAVAIIGGLREGLDPDKSPTPLADLDSLYDYMMRRLTEANIKNDPLLLDEVSGLLSNIKEGWDAIEPGNASL